MVTGALIAGGVLGMVAVTALVVGGMSTTRPVAIPRFGATSRRLLTVLEFRDLALPRDSDLRPVDVGAMVEGLGTRRVPAVSCDEAPDDSPIAARRTLPCLDPAAVLPAAARGLTTAERHHLERFLGHPGLPVLEAMARAAGYARPAVPPATDVADGARPLLPWEVPVPRLTLLRQAAAIEVARAGLRFADGDVAAADTTLREVLSAGLLLVEDGPTLIEGLVGAVITRQGLDGLVQLYQAAGRDADARRLTGRIEAAERRATSLTGDAPGSDGRPRPTAESVEAELVDPATPRPLRWELAGLVPWARSCQGMEAVLFGPSASHRRHLEEARAQLVRDPGDAERFAMAAEGIQRLHERTRLYPDLTFEAPGLDLPRWAGYAAIPVEVSAALLRNPRIDACFWMLTGT